ncbi:hypothetical protein BY458DRAFT_512015 [Sporodiniella umbellata]|nr:hypothetical protein BY458DRAFT_512015 [Sporodiniella umbellata]
MIVTQSLEYVSKAHQRETDYQKQLAELKKENAQLQRQAMLVRKNQHRKRKAMGPSQANKRSRASTSTGHGERRCSNSTCDSEFTLQQPTVSSIPAIRTPIVETGHQIPYDLDLLNLYPSDAVYDGMFLFFSFNDKSFEPTF